MNISRCGSRWRNRENAWKRAARREKGMKHAGGGRGGASLKKKLICCSQLKHFFKSDYFCTENKVGFFMNRFLLHKHVKKEKKILRKLKVFKSNLSCKWKLIDDWLIQICSIMEKHFRDSFQIQCSTTKAVTPSSVQTLYSPKSLLCCSYALKNTRKHRWRPAFPPCALTPPPCSRGAGSSEGSAWISSWAPAGQWIIWPAEEQSGRRSYDEERRAGFVSFS